MRCGMSPRSLHVLPCQPLTLNSRYIRAFEVGQGPTSAKYDLAVKLNTMKNGPVIRNRLRLPFPVDTSTRVCVICVPGSKAEQEAIKAGAVLYGEEEVFKTIKEGKIEFDRCICHADSTAAMAKAQLGRILGPRGLMPNAKTGTVVKSVARAVSDMMGASQYRERSGVIRLAIGQLGYTPEEMQRNLVAFMTQVKQDCAAASDRIPKDVFEVVLSSTQSPGFSLNGNFRSPDSPSTQALSV